MKMVYDVGDKPKAGKLIVFAFQQMLAILAATIAVPMIIGNGLTPSAAMFGAGVGTLVYVFFTKKKSPVFLGSSFAFIGSMFSAFAGGVSMQLGMLGLLLGVAYAGLVYVLLSFLVKKIGVRWIDRLMPPVVIGPTVAIIGLSLAANAVSDLGLSGIEGVRENPNSFYAALSCGLVTLAVTMICSTYGSKNLKLVPFVAGIGAGYVTDLVMTCIGGFLDIQALRIIDVSLFRKYMFEDGVSLKTFVSVPNFVFTKAIDGFDELSGSYILTIIMAYVPVSFVVFAEHIADHKNLSSVIGKDLLKDPGLSRTLLGDGVGSIAGAFFGGCPNTTYGESVACVAITGNASVSTIIAAALGCIVLSFVTPFVALISSIPNCVMGGVCIALYGFIAVSGLKMFKHVDLDQNHNLFTASVILVTGIGGLSISFGDVTITNIATALILGILTNLLLTVGKTDDNKEESGSGEQ